MQQAVSVENRETGPTRAPDFDGEPGAAPPALALKRSPMRLLALTLAAVVAGEMAVMLAIAWIGSTSPLLDALVDGLLLSIFVFPVLYVFLLKPLQRSYGELAAARESLARSDETYRALIDSTEDSIYLVDAACRYLLINKPHAARLGLAGGPPRRPGVRRRALGGGVGTVRGDHRLGCPQRKLRAPRAPEREGRQVFPAELQPRAGPRRTGGRGDGRIQGDHRTQAARAADAVPLDPGRTDGALQSPRLRRPRRSSPQGRGTPGQRRRALVRRSRQPQGGQRHPRPPRRGPDDQGRGPHSDPGVPGIRHRDPPRRRRVRRPPRRFGARGGGGDHREDRGADQPPQRRRAAGRSSP